MTALLVIVGLVVVLVGLGDLVWTVVTPGSGGGPIARRFTSWMWRAALAGHHPHGSHRLLTVVGVASVVLTVVLWMAIVVAGWSLVFASSPSAVLVTATGEPVGLAERFYFAGYTVFTLGNGELRPAVGTWQLATVAASGTGWILTTLSITFLVPLASAAARTREMARYLYSLGPDAVTSLVEAWTGEEWGNLNSHLVSLTGLVHSVRQLNDTYPMLRYLHPRDPRSALAPSLVMLEDLMLLLRAGVREDLRPDPATIGPLDRAVGDLGAAVTEGHRRRTGESLAPPSRQPLADAGIPLAPREHYVEAVEARRDRRRRLASALREDGWPMSRTAEVGV